MCNEEQIETAFCSVGHYRQLWLDDAHALGMIAETLADVLGWQPTGDEILPDPLALADEAACRIAELERLLSGIGHRGPQRSSSLHRSRVALN